jgi:hypothetical protein
MTAAAHALGLQAEARDDASLEDLEHALAANAPCVCCVQRHGGGHWVVVTGVGPDSVEIMDPLEGHVSVPRDEFTANWWDTANGRRYDRFALAVGPPAVVRESILHRFLEAADVPVLTPDAAIDFFRALIPTLGTDPGRVLPDLRRTAFTLAAATEQELLQAVKGVILDRLTTGQASTGPAAVRAALDAAGVGDGGNYATTVFRTNVMDSYNQGLHDELKDLADTFPVWKYSNPGDNRSRPDHSARSGNYYPASVTIDQVRGTEPKEKMNCRCVPIPVDKWTWADLYAKGTRVAQGYPDVRVSEGFVLLEGFTGEKKDSLGRTYYWVDGKRVARSGYEAAGHKPTPIKPGTVKPAGKPPVKDAGPDKAALAAQARDGLAKAATATRKPTAAQAAKIAVGLPHLTVPELKEHLKVLGEKLGGRKDELIARVKEKLAQSKSKKAAPKPKAEKPAPEPKKEEPATPTMPATPAKTRPPYHLVNDYLKEQGINPADVRGEKAVADLVGKLQTIQPGTSERDIRQSLDMVKTDDAERRDNLTAPAPKPPGASVGKPTTPPTNGGKPVTFGDRASWKDAEAYSHKTHGEWGKSLPAVQKQALKVYTSESQEYEKINGALRAGQVPVKHADTVRHLDAAIASAPPLPDPMTVYRGVGPGVLDQLMPGQEFTDHGFSSSSSRLAIAEDFNANERYEGNEAGLIEISTPVGMCMAAVEPTGQATLHEAEYIMPRGTRYRVLSNEPHPKYGSLVKVEVIPNA